MRIKIVVALLCSIILIACQGPQPTDDEARTLTRSFVDAVNAGEYEKAFNLVSPEFFQTRSRDRWIEYYDKIKETMGPVISVKLSRHLNDNRLSGRFYMYQYSIKHENGFTKEMVTMIQKINSNDPLTILSHKIDSSKLLKINEMY